MLCSNFLLGCSVYLFAVLVLQMRNANAISLVKIQDSLYSTASPTSGPSREHTSPNHVSTTKAGEGIKTSEMSSPGSEEISLPTTVAVQPTTEEPPCWKKNKELTAFLDRYAMFGITLQDFSRPDCDSDGYYKPRQCHFGGCQCVARDGTPNSKFSSEFGLVCPTTKEIFADFSPQ